MRVLVTGAAGFIGAEVCIRLLQRGDAVVGVDNLNDYYDVDLKKARLSRFDGFDKFKFLRLDLADSGAIAKLFRDHQFDAVVNLAAQAGVRYSLENPNAYAQSNLVGFLNVLEGCREQRVQHCVYASSSSVYGANAKMPYSVSDNVDHPVSLYAATKKSNELMAHAYSHLFGLNMTGLRFFTVYGPWGRPDMAYFKFTKAILSDEPIDVFNNGEMKRDFTYIDDIVEGVVRVIDTLPQPEEQWNGLMPQPGVSYAPYRIYNIGNSKPISLLGFINVLEETLGRQARKRMMSMQPGDVKETCADTRGLELAVGYSPSTPLDIGIKKFVAWYREYYGVRDRN